MQRLDFFIFSLVLALCGVAWVPVVPGFEIANAMALSVVLLSAAFIRRGVLLPRIYVLLSFALLLMYFGLLAHGWGGEKNVIRATAYLVMGIALAQVPLPDLGRVASLSTAVFVGIIYLSAFVAGENLVLATVEYLTTLNRKVFVFQSVRPMLNAFATGEAEYVASVINIISSALAILFIISITHRAYIAAGVSGLLVFILFSSSSILSVTVTLLLLGVRWLILSPHKLGPLAVLAVGLLAAAVAFEQAIAYFAVNLSSDGGSRAARLAQYSASLEFINTKPIWGGGFVYVNGYSIHNSFLFAWVSAGLLPALLVLAVYITAIYKAARASLRALNGNVQWACVFGLLVLFLIRISFGGGGGLPGATATTALAVGLCLERDLISKSPAPVFPHERSTPSRDGTPSQQGLRAEAAMDREAV